MGILSWTPGFPIGVFSKSQKNPMGKVVFWMICHDNYVIFCLEIPIGNCHDHLCHFLPGNGISTTLTLFDNFWQLLTTNEVFWILQGARPTFCYLTSPLRGAHPSVPGGLGGFPPQSIGILRCGCFVLDFAGKNEFLKLFYVKIWNDWFLIWSNWNRGG